MKASTFLFKAATAAIFATATVFLSACNSETEAIRFGSGNKGGLYDKFANTFAESFNASNNGSQIQVKNTAGTSANIRLIEEGFLDMAIVQADILKDYLMRSRMRHAIAAIGGLYTESIQIVVAGDSEINSVADLMGKRVSVGEEESGVLRNAEIILEAYGIASEKIQARNLNFSDAAAALKAGEIDAFFCTAGIPTPSISELAGNKNVRILSLDSIDMSRIMNLHPELTFSEIPAGTYAGQDSAVHTLGAKAVLVASQMLSGASVTKVTEAIFAKSASGNEAPSLEFASTNIPVGFHPGAAAFYKGKGLKVEEAAPLQARGPIPSTGD